MNNQETPVQDQETPLSIEQPVNVESQESGATPPEPTPLPSEESPRPTTPSPAGPPMQPPSGWPVYYPETAPQSRGRYQYGSPYARRRSPWPWIVLALILLFVLLTGAALFTAIFARINYTGFTSTETRQFSVSANPTLVLTNDIGSIHVRAGSTGNDMTIQAIKHSSFGSNLNDVRVSYRQNTEANTVNVTLERTTTANFSRSTTVDFEVTVPSAATLQLKTNTGSIDVTGVSGSMVLVSNTGSIEASNGKLSGTSQLITNTGSITFNGSIDHSGSYQFTTNTGSVNVTLPSESVFHVNASTDTGSINTNFAGVIVQPHQFTGADAHGDVGNSPQAMVSLRTNTGSINLFQR